MGTAAGRPARGSGRKGKGRENGGTWTGCGVRGDCPLCGVRGDCAVGGFAQIENTRVGTVRPGSTFAVSFDVHNIMNDYVKYVYVKAPVSTSFQPVGYDTWASPGQIARDGRERATFIFKADDNLVAGVYSLPFLLTSESKTLSGASLSGGLVSSLQTLTTTEYVYVKVDGAPSLVVSQKSSVPALVEAGKEATVTFDVFNNGTDTAREIAIDVGSPDKVSVGSASRHIYLGELAPKARTAFSVGFLADGAPGRTGFVLPVGVSWNGGSASQDQGITLRTATRLEIVQIRGAILRGVNDQKLSVVVRNAGNSPAEGIRATILTSYPLTPSGRDSFIQSLAPGEEKALLFSLDADSQGALQEYPLQFAVTYDDHSRSESDVLDASVPLQKGAGGAYYWLAVPVVLFAALFAFGKLKRKPKKE